MARLPALARSSGMLRSPSEGHLGAQVLLVLHPPVSWGAHSRQAEPATCLPPSPNCAAWIEIVQRLSGERLP